jgi:serine/threonine protein kinase
MFPLFFFFFFFALVSSAFVPSSDSDDDSLSTGEAKQLPVTAKSHAWVVPRQYASACADRHVVTDPALVNVISGSPRRYEQVKALGHGSAGALMYTAVDRETAEPVLLKWLSKETTVAEVQREILMLTQVVDLPDTQHLRDVLLDPHGPPTLVFKQFPMEPFGTLVSQMTLSDVRSFGRRLLQLVDSLHRRCIIHGGLATSTVLMSRSMSSLTVTGWANARHYVPKTKIVVKHRDVAAQSVPEFLFGVRGFSYGVDLWSVGALLLTFLTGKPTFAASAMRDQATLVAHFAGKVAFDAFVEKYHIQLDPAWSKTLWKATVTDASNVTAMVSATGKFDTSACGDVIRVVERLLRVDPDERMTAKEALDSLQS